MDNVWPARPSPTDEDRPSLASAVPDSVRPVVLLGFKVIAPLAEIDEVPPVTTSMAESRSFRLSPMPIEEPEEVELAVKVKVVPFTTSVSPVVKAEARSLDVEPAVPPDNRVEPLIAAVVVLSELSAVPETEV